MYLTGLLGGRTVIPSIAGRTAEIAGDDVRQRVFASIAPPPLGSPQEEYTGRYLRVSSRTCPLRPARTFWRETTTGSP